MNTPLHTISNWDRDSQGLVTEPIASAANADPMRVERATIQLGASKSRSRRKAGPVLSTTRKRTVIDGPFAETKEFIGSRT